MKKLITPLVACALASMAPLAHATIQLHYSIDGGATVDCSIGANSSNCADVNSGALQFTGLSGFANLTGTPTLGIASNSNTNLFNTTGSNHTIHIEVIAQGFSQPVTPPSLSFLNHVSTTTAVGASANSFSFVGCVDTSNGSGGCPGTPGVAPYVSATLTPNIAPTGSKQADSPELVIDTLAALFAIDQEIDITLGAKGFITFSGSSTLTPVPEPMNIALLGGVVLLMSRLIRRKQNQAA